MVKVLNPKSEIRNKSKIQNPKFKILFCFYFFLLFLLFLYSFTQIDLNLTLCRFQICTLVKENFIKIGYFNRPLSTAIYLFLILGLFFFYFLILWLVFKKKLSEKQVWVLIFLTVLTLLFSYSAFSYDIFNYMFDARILTKHHLNPYQYKALDFPEDPWTRFMHWTHRTYPYAPLWLVFSFSPSFLGLGFFLPTLYLFKVLASIFHLSTAFILGKIASLKFPQKKLLTISFFAFNPLVLIENLVSGHHDIMMIFFALFAIYLISIKKYLPGVFAFTISVGIKYTTLILAPIFGLILLNKKIGLRKICFFSFWLLSLTLIYFHFWREIKPWYIVWLIPFASLIWAEKLPRFLTLSFSIGFLLHYAPYLYFGHWNNPVPNIKLLLIFFSLFLTIILWFLSLFQESRKPPRGFGTDEGRKRE